MLYYYVFISFLQIGDVAVALCRAPELTLFTFSLPDCQLLTETPIRGSVVDSYDLDQRFLMRDNSMMFMLHHQDFFKYDEEEDGNYRYGAMLFVDFEEYVACRKKKDGAKDKLDSLSKSIKLKIDKQFDVSCHYVEKISVLSKTKLVCSLNTGFIVVRDIKVGDGATSEGGCVAATHEDTLIIKPPEKIKDEYTDSTLSADTDTLGSDSPTLCVSRDGDLVVEMRHFRSGRKLYAYDLKRQGQMRYCVDLDDPRYELNPLPGYVSIDMDGNFLCAADLGRVVVWDSRNGRYVRSLPIVPHYNAREDPSEAEEPYCWKGHTDFAFAEDGIIIIHSQRNFPAAADVMLFW